MPVIRDPRDFDSNSGSLAERLIFNHRLIVVAICALITLFLGFHATRLSVNASFEKTIPSSHPYIKNYLENAKELRGLGNTLRIVVENRNGDIYDPRYLETLKKVNDSVYLMQGVDRSWMKSLWMPLVRWTEVTEDGYSGGPVMPADFNGSSDSISALRKNVTRAGISGTLVANDQRSSMIIVPLLDRDVRTGAPLDYRVFSHELERRIRAAQTPDVDIHIVGFGKLVGDLMDGLVDVARFFGVAVAIATAFLFWYTRCWRSTVLLVLISLTGVVWLLGLMQLTGYDLDPYSILVPFLIFAIGLSHGSQKMNGIMQDIARGTHRYVAARYTFRRLFLAGLTALLTNIVGFAVLMLIDIPIIRNMALQTSIGVCILIVTKLILIPVMLSYVGVSPKAAARHANNDEREIEGSALTRHWWNHLDVLTERRWALTVVAIFLTIGMAGFVVSQRVKVGDLDPGAPELRKSSRYNRDDAYVTAHYGLSSDQFAVIVKTPANECASWANLVGMDDLTWSLAQLPGVQTVVSLPDIIRHVTAGQFDGNGKWQTISRDQRLVDAAFSAVQSAAPDATDESCSVTPIIAYLTDHKAATLSRVLDEVVDYGKKHDSSNIQFLPAAGSAGIEAITNVVVQAANRNMLILLYGAVSVLCLLTFRSWRAVVVALVPLVITSVLCEALMVALGIGIKVATLPVTALGVGVGVDYALYLLSVQLAMQRSGATLTVAYRKSVMFTGKVVGLVGVTLAAGVITWAWSPIKFQADMGILLAFMFLWNMLGAVVLIPALSYFLLRDAFDTTDVKSTSALEEGHIASGASTESSDDGPANIRTAS
ncbi:efflux RND transporter permease subunit [Paraburkholderia sp. GAS32]|uniref:efflux RND transporter permease subunit n=1 Tax=Paraburkholderia sp. GAS32 TaxID=3035129 RepID=UPI003D247E49